MSHRYVCRKDDPLKIVAAGGVPAGGLGYWNPDIYQEVEGDLPEGYRFEFPGNLINQYDAIAKDLSVTARGKYYAKRPLIETAHALGDWGFIEAIVEELDIPQEAKATMLMGIQDVKKSYEEVKHD